MSIPIFRLGLTLFNRGSRKTSKVIIGDGKFRANKEGFEREGMNANDGCRKNARDEQKVGEIG